jgi:hypothetical protein
MHNTQYIEHYLNTEKPCILNIYSLITTKIVCIVFIDIELYNFISIQNLPVCINILAILQFNSFIMMI